MEELRSRSYAGGGRMETESCRAASTAAGLHMVRCCSASCTASRRSASQAQPPGEEGKSASGRRSSSSSSSSFVGWSLIGDPELQRKRRVAGYKVYAVEGKVKGSFRKSCRWIKDKYTQLLYGRC